MIISAINKDFQDNSIFLTRIYPVGQLEEKIGYDLLRTTSKELYDKIEGANLLKNSNIVFNSEALLSNGEISPVKIILWKESRFNGIIGCVALDDDEEGLKKAFQLQESKALAI